MIKPQLLAARQLLRVVGGHEDRARLQHLHDGAVGRELRVHGGTCFADVVPGVDREVAGALVALRCDPTLQAVAAGAELLTLAALAGDHLVIRQDLQHLASVHPSQHPASLHLCDVRHGHSIVAVEEIRTRLNEGPVLLPDLQPTRGLAVLLGTPRPEGCGGAVAGALDDLDHLSGMQQTERLAGYVGIPVEGCFLRAPQERLLCVLQVRRPCIALDGDPPTSAVLDSPALQPLQAEDRVLPGLPDDLDDFPLVELPEAQPVRLDLKLGRQADVADNLAVIRQSQSETLSSEAMRAELLEGHLHLLLGHFRALRSHELGEAVAIDHVLTLRKLSEECARVAGLALLGGQPPQSILHRPHRHRLQGLQPLGEGSGNSLSLLRERAAARLQAAELNARLGRQRGCLDVGQLLLRREDRLKCLRCPLVQRLQLLDRERRHR
mmetsp:Transcript_49007/g.153948  ORF Transcript_49007/g.153948 Transcript_49007/m.153948 type:complete len:438 (-) Transcript_49007:512-1825(-)